MEQEFISDQQDSIEISRTAKGQCSWKIKRYYDYDQISDQEVISQIEEIDKKLQKKFGGLKE